ncbi:DUF4839 domain-containing protein [Gordonia sp. UBA7860]|uniref:DUF4839 domain-containing protein n=1 Tax=Gordonia sp. UBA7860 TaxID=1946579 RepID=UPI00257BB209|nr:DUF4839 domain-containing protein [Gordonia sp. UBA7860]
MASGTEVAYETKTVRAVRGMEPRTIKKWEADGWEYVSQSPGTVQTEITFRRPRSKSRRLLWIIGGSVLVLVLAIIIAVGVVSEKNAVPAESANAAPSDTTATTSRQTETARAAPSRSPKPDEAVLTPKNSPELAAVLGLTDYCSPRIAAFASAHRGQTIQFPGSVGAMAPHGDAKTRYDILINAGDYSETSAPGPAFQFRDENTINDLHWVGPVPDTIGVGTNLRITAKVDRYEERSCLFLLEPIATAIR